MRRLIQTATLAAVLGMLLTACAETSLKGPRAGGSSDVAMIISLLVALLFGYLLYDHSSPSQTFFGAIFAGCVANLIIA